MKQIVRYAFLILSAVLILSACAAGGEDNRTPTPPDLDIIGTETPVLPVTGGTTEPGQAGAVDESGLGGLYPNTFTKLLGYPVLSQDCDPVADLNGFIISPSDGVLLYAVAIPDPSALGVEGEFLIPWQAMDLVGVSDTQPAVTCSAEGNDQAFILRMPAADLNGAPVIEGHDSGELFADPEWEGQTKAFWSQLGITLSPGPQSESTGQGGELIYLRNMASMVVAGPDTNQVLEPVQIIIDPVNQRITHVLIYDGVRFILVPWANFTVSSVSGLASLNLNASAEQLTDAPGFADPLEISDTATPGWDEEIQSYWGGVQ